MALLSKEKEVIKNDYFRVWDIVELLYKKTDNNWDEVGQFLGHYNFDTELTLYQQDAYCRINEVVNNYLPIRKLIDGLNMVWLEGEESIQNIKLGIINYYWHKHEIYNFKPIMDLGIIANPPTQVATVQSAQESQPDRYKFFLYKQPLFSTDECACIISDYDPLEILRYSSGDIDEIAPDYSRAYSFVNSSIEAGKLNIFNYKIDADNLKNYLASENIIITGFNDQIPEQESVGCGTPSIQQSLQEIERLKADLAQAQERIKQLEAEKQENTISNELTGIEKLNQSAKDRQGMARVIAMKLWKDDQSILIGAMADKVYREMINYCVDELPDNADTLKNWIRPIATSQAQRRGRPPKKSTT